MESRSRYYYQTSTRETVTNRWNPLISKHETKDDKDNESLNRCILPSDQHITSHFYSPEDRVNSRNPTKMMLQRRTSRKRRKSRSLVSAVCFKTRATMTTSRSFPEGQGHQVTRNTMQKQRNGSTSNLLQSLLNRCSQAYLLS